MLGSSSWPERISLLLLLLLLPLLVQMAQGGDFHRGDGYGGESIYGQFMRDEKYLYKHSKRGEKQQQQQQQQKLQQQQHAFLHTDTWQQQPSEAKCTAGFLRPAACLGEQLSLPSSSSRSWGAALLLLLLLLQGC